MQYCGFDLAKVATQICIKTEDGRLIERRIKTTGEELSKFFGDQPRTRILIEAATESEWVAQHLES
jgi:predicted nucleic-acid-binding Zn-ribbon protein